MIKKTNERSKNLTKNMNVKFSEDDYEQLQEIARDIGINSLSAMIRTLIYTQLEEVKKTGDPKSFLGINKK